MRPTVAMPYIRLKPRPTLVTKADRGENASLAMGMVVIGRDLPLVTLRPDAEAQPGEVMGLVQHVNADLQEDRGSAGAQRRGGPCAERKSESYHTTARRMVGKV